jgi:ribosomal protein S8E
MHEHSEPWGGKRRKEKRKKNFFIAHNPHPTNTGKDLPCHRERVKDRVQGGGRGSDRCHEKKHLPQDSVVEDMPLWK